MTIVSTGRYIPQTVVSNDDMAKIVETNDEWISTRTGIKTRCMAGGEPTSYMAAEASRHALEGFDGSASDIGMIVCSTITPDFHTPSVACLVQQAIGAKNAFCLDISCACSGFVHALDLAYRYISCGEIEHALVVSAETLSHIADFTDRSTCVLFGDGAGACVVSRGENKFASYMGADGDGAQFLYAASVYPQTPFETETGRNGHKSFDYAEDGFIHMNGKEVYKFSTSVMPLAIGKACEKMGIAPEELDLIIPHQANVRIVQTAMKHLHLPMEKAYLNIDKYGNTSSASIPIALDEAVREGAVKRGDTIAVVGFGAGLTYGASVFNW
ncbi:MAG: ketoacyl-ACP synthase III [Clostridiales bacterium]|nr:MULTISPECIES: beta-ketoacyl-ACP synthase III [Oscillospiraceae]PWM35637.1 MAG: ketoacyl-ACP synthase III [Clostridiales bacterium]RGB65282.1 ketoacyl-ACP synthase III [Harryflintia acetispora]